MTKTKTEEEMFGKTQAKEMKRGRFNDGVVNGCVQKIMMEAKRCIPAEKAICQYLVFVSYETFQDAVETAVAKAIRDSR